MSADTILTLNAGSSSIKFALYAFGAEPEELARGQIENLGPAARLKIGRTGAETETHELGAADHALALQEILSRSLTLLGDRRIVGVGHRIVHGGVDFSRPRELDRQTVARLRALSPLAPLHQPYNLAAVEGARSAFPDAIQIGCFDTAFHRGQPWVSDTFALPRAYYEKGVRRYGFHGLSYGYVTGELQRTAPDVAGGRVVIAHLGNGASMCAVQAGRSVASTMGFSALDGLPMGTRCGQLDPAVVLYLMDEEKLTTAQISDFLYKACGLKGLAGLSHDMRTLEASDAPEAKEAIDYFVFRIRREIGAMAAILGGIDALVFCGGIGENSVLVRARVCEAMEWLGIRLDEGRNGANQQRIGTGPTEVFVIATDEERVMARAVNQAHSAS
ncbi:MAG: acetate/propionate family kinase [Geminicoccaceae bacterium]